MRRFGQCNRDRVRVISSFVKAALDNLCAAAV